MPNSFHEYYKRTTNVGGLSAATNNAVQAAFESTDLASSLWSQHNSAAANYCAKATAFDSTPNALISSNYAMLPTTETNLS